MPGIAYLRPGPLGSYVTGIVDEAGHELARDSHGPGQRRQALKQVARWRRQGYEPVLDWVGYPFGGKE